MSTIFISHSSQDNDIAREIGRRLDKQKHHSVFLDIDPEKGIVGGQSWERTLYRKLRACRVVIALCTDHYLDSHWCFAEIALARMEGKHIVALQADPLDEQAKMPAILTERQFIDLRRDGDEGYQRLWEALKALDIVEGTGTWNPKKSPYLGLSAYQEKHASVFFGREDESRAGIELLDRGAPGLIMVLGASGSGKSSLVRAGMLPRLRSRKDEWLIVDPFRPGRDPLAELTESLVQSYRRYAPERAPEAENRERIRERLHAGLRDPSISDPLAADESEGQEQMPDAAEDERLRRLMDLLERLHEDPPPLLAGRLRDYLEWSLDDLRRICGEQAAVVSSPEIISHYTTPLIEIAHDLRQVSQRREARVLIVIDQFEELLGRKKRDEETGRFLALLRASIEADHSPLMILGTMRSDFLGLFQRNAALRGIDFESLSLGPMKIEGMRRVIEKPAKRVAIELESGLTDRLLEDTETPDALPLLSFTLEVLWRKHHGDHKFEIADYENLGGLQGAITGEADAVLKSARLKHREDDFRKALIQMARLSEDGRYARRPVNWDAQEIRRIEPFLKKLIERRILVSRMEGERRIVEVAHEALFRAWKPLRAWLDNARSELLLKQQLERDAKAWQKSRRAADNLWRGGRLLQARDMMGKQNLRGAAAKGNLVAEFVRAGLRRRLRLRATVAATTFITIAILAGFLGYALVQKKKAEERAITAEATLRWSPFDLSSKLSYGEVEGLLTLARDDKAVKRAFAKYLKGDAALAARFSQQPKAITRALAGLDTDARDWLIQDLLVTPMPKEANPAVRTALGFLAAELEAAEGYHHLLEAIQITTESRQPRELEKGLATLAAKLTPAQAEPAIERLVVAIQANTEPIQLAVLGKTLAAMPVELPPAQAEPAVDRLVAAIQLSTDSAQLKELGGALVTLAAKLPPARAKHAVERLVAAIQTSTDSAQLKELGEAMVTLAAKLPPAQAEPAVERLVRAIQPTSDSRQLRVLGKALEALPVELTPAQAESAFDKMVGAIQATTDSRQFSVLGEALEALVAKLTPAQAEPAIERVVVAIRDTTDSNDYRQRRVLGDALVTLAAKLHPSEAEPAIARLVDAIQIQVTSKSKELGALGEALAAIAAKVTPAQAESAFDKLVGAIQATTDSRQFSVLGEALEALVAKLAPVQAESAVERLVAALQAATDSRQLRQLAKALAAIAAKLTPAQAESAVKKLVAAIQAKTNYSQIRELWNALAALAVKLPPAQVEFAVESLVAALQATTNYRQLEELGKALSTLVAKLIPAQAEPAVEKLVTAILATTEPSQIGVIGKALVTLPVELPPALADSAVDRLVAAHQATTNSDLRIELGEALEALVAKLTPVQAEPVVKKLVATIQATADFSQLRVLWKVAIKLPPPQAEPAIERLVAALQATTDSRQLKQLANALATIAAKLTPAQAESAVEKLVAALQAATDSRQLRQLASALATIAAELTAAQAESAVDRLVDALQATTDSRLHSELLEALVALAAKLTQTQAESAVDRLVGAFQATTKPPQSGKQFWTLGKDLVTIATKLTPAQAEPAAERLIAAIQATTDLNHTWVLGKALAALPVELSPALAEPVFEILVAAIQATTDPTDKGQINRQIWLGEALAALAAKLTPALAEPAFERLAAAIQATTEPRQLGLLGKALAALPVELPPALAEPAVDRLITAIQAITDSRQFSVLGAALEALTAKLTPVQAESAVDRLVAAIQATTKFSDLRRELGEAMEALAAKLTPAQAVPVIERLVDAIQVTTESGQLETLGEALADLAAKLSDDQDFAALVFEILKYPNIREVSRSTSAEGILLDAVRKRFEDKRPPDKGKGFWEMVKWAKKQFPYLDLKSPPKVRERKKQLKKQG